MSCFSFTTAPEWTRAYLSGLLALFVIALPCRAQTPADALAFERDNQWAQAAEAWRAVVKRNPQDAAAFASLGLDLARQEKYEEAVPAYRKALTLNPRLPGVELDLGLAEFKQGHFRSAIAPLRSVSAADPNSLQARA